MRSIAAALKRQTHRLSPILIVPASIQTGMQEQFEVAGAPPRCVIVRRDFTLAERSGGDGGSGRMTFGGAAAEPGAQLDALDSAAGHTSLNMKHEDVSASEMAAALAHRGQHAVTAAAAVGGSAQRLPSGGGSDQAAARTDEYEALELRHAEAGGVGGVGAAEGVRSTKRRRAAVAPGAAAGAAEEDAETHGGADDGDEGAGTSLREQALGSKREKRKKRKSGSAAASDAQPGATQPAADRADELVADALLGAPQSSQGSPLPRAGEVNAEDVNDPLASTRGCNDGMQDGVAAPQADVLPDESTAGLTGHSGALRTLLKEKKKKNKKKQSGQCAQDVIAESPVVGSAIV